MAIRLDIDGRSIEVDEGTTLYDAAASAGIAIRRLCHDPKLAPVGMCRLCAVEVEGERVLAASCVRRAESGMVVHTGSTRVERAQRVLTELLASEQPDESAKRMTTADY